MAYDEYIAERIRRELKILKVPFEELKMMGGLCIKLDGKMLCGILPQKNEKRNLLMARDLSRWLQHCIDFNPLAKASKKKKKTKTLKV